MTPLERRGLAGASGVDDLVDPLMREVHDRRDLPQAEASSNGFADGLVAASLGVGVPFSGALERLLRTHVRLSSSLDTPSIILDMTKTRCDCMTVRGDRCSRPAVIEGWTRHQGWERYCSQHANAYGVRRRRHREITEKP